METPKVFNFSEIVENAFEEFTASNAYFSFKIIYLRNHEVQLRFLSSCCQSLVARVSSGDDTYKQLCLSCKLSKPVNLPAGVSEEPPHQKLEATVQAWIRYYEPPLLAVVDEAAAWEQILEAMPPSWAPLSVAS